ncbi:helix-turn-helix domain-containing protein [Streptomyces afghaniensis]|uniref:helix-turn-helix domain-containing protein n=1 Tax=Streptomyces afghaniensis TaxID=66865 RepID=UPI00378EBF15
MHRPGDGRHVDTVRRWRGRFAQADLPGLKDRQRCGRPASFTPLQAAEVKSLARRLPAGSEVPLSRWSAPNWPTRPPGGASPRSCRRRPCVAGWPGTRSSPGSSAMTST